MWDCGSVRPRPHSHRLRTGRWSEANRIYLVTTATRSRRPLFHDFALGRIVVTAFRFQEQSGRAKTMAFVVMPDHFHWLLQLEAATRLKRVVHSVKGYSAWAINHASGTVRSSVWQEGFHDHAVRREESLVELARYVIENPLRAGLVEHIGDYPLWDSLWLP